MKRFLPALIIFLAACSTEDKVGPASAATFVRYFNGGNNDDAQAILQTPDNGFVLLANTEIKDNDGNSRFKIKLIKTDAFGNQIWQMLYPAFSSIDNDKSYKAHSLIILPDGGYAIAGEDIQTNSSNLMLMITDSNGENPVFKAVKLNYAVSGVGVAINESGNFIALGEVPNSTQAKNMVLCEFTKTTSNGQVKLDSVWSNAYGAGKGTLASRLFLDQKNNAFWGGTIQKNNTSLTSIRFVKVITNHTNQGGIDFDLPVSTPGLTESGNDFCKYGTGFAVIGSTNGKKSGASTDQDIVFKRLAEDGSELLSISYPLTELEPNLDLAEQDEIGNSICTTRDGGLLLLGTVDTQAQRAFGRGDKDLYLIKTDAFGTKLWSKSYGSKFEDIGVNVIQASDGGYVILGNTNLSKVNTIMLLKVDANGEIE